MSEQADEVQGDLGGGSQRSAFRDFPADHGNNGVNPRAWARPARTRPRWTTTGTQAWTIETH